MQTVFYGARDAMVAEVAAFDPATIGIPARECRYLVLPTGDSGDYDTEWFSSRKLAREFARDLAAQYQCKVTGV